MVQWLLWRSARTIAPMLPRVRRSCCMRWWCAAHHATFPFLTCLLDAYRKVHIRHGRRP